MPKNKAKLQDAPAQPVDRLQYVSQSILLSKESGIGDGSPDGALQESPVTPTAEARRIVEYLATARSLSPDTVPLRAALDAEAKRALRGELPSPLQWDNVPFDESRGRHTAHPAADRLRALAANVQPAIAEDERSPFPLGDELMKASLSAYAHCACAVRLDAQGNSGAAWRHAIKAAYWAGAAAATVGEIGNAWASFAQLAPIAEKLRQRKAGEPSQADNRRLKAEVREWCDAHLTDQMDLDPTAVDLLKVFPLKSARTIRGWLKEYRDARNAVRDWCGKNLTDSMSVEEAAYLLQWHQRISDDSRRLSNWVKEYRSGLQSAG